MVFKLEQCIQNVLIALYGNADIFAALQHLIRDLHVPPYSTASATGSLQHPMLIAYGDHLQAHDEAPLATLHRFAKSHLTQLINSIHLLPFYPYTSDDGFSVVDFRAVNPKLGDWSIIEALQQDFTLMFDLVLNHVSISSEWFQRFLRDEAPYNEYFITLPPETDLSQVVRPRTHPVLTPFETTAGRRYVWTTFSTDQVDLNYANPLVLLEMIRILLDYVAHGASYIRLDAVAFLWKIPGTSCIHLPQTHLIIQLLRNVLELAAPWVRLITETNVPHHENISYFGNGHNEAHLVYQFALPPLLLHTLNTGDATILSQWAGSLQLPSTDTAFFNFTASHDGIGIRPVVELLSSPQIDQLLQTVKDRQGQISYRTQADGSYSPYEMNITYFDALARPDEPLSTNIDRFMISQAIMLALGGLPAIYLPSLFGAANWQAGVSASGRARTINREKFDLPTLEAVLADPQSHYGQVFARYKALLKAHWQLVQAAMGEQQRVLTLHPAVFTIQRGVWLALHNVSNQPVSLSLPTHGPWRNILRDELCSSPLTLSAYETQWLQLEITK